MQKNKKPQSPSAETVDEAMKIAKGIQKLGQTKEQTKLIAQGIQKGIAQYKKQLKAKAHELDRLKKKLNQQKANTDIERSIPSEVSCKTQWLPWILLIVSWLAMLLYIVLSSGWFDV